MPSAHGSGSTMRIGTPSAVRHGRHQPALDDDGEGDHDDDDPVEPVGVRARRR